MSLIEDISGYYIQDIINNHHNFEYSEDDGITWKPVRRDSFLYRALAGGLLVRKIK